MATTTYDWQDVDIGFYVNTDSFGHQNFPAVAGMGKHGFVAAWAGGTTGQLPGRTFDRGGDPTSGEFATGLDHAGNQYAPALAGQPNGRALLAFTSADFENGGSDIFGRLIRADGTGADFEITIANGDFFDSDADVAALADGGFVVSWTRLFGSSDFDVRAQIVNANGTLRGATLGVDNSSTLATLRSTVAGLAGGGFVVGWQQGPLNSTSNAVAFVRYDHHGVPLDDDPVIIDTTGTVKEDLQIVGLPDGGFALAYVDDGWNTDTREITAKVFNADGTARSGFILVNFGTTGGDQSNPSITVLGNGYFMVGWSDADRLYYQAFDPDGNRAGDISSPGGLVIEGELAGMSGGLLASVRSSTYEDEDGQSIRGSVTELVRTVTGDGSNETINGDALADRLLGLGGKDKLSGLNGKDTLEGGDGADVLRGGLDKDLLIGGAGADKYVYNDIAQSRPGPGADIIKGFRDGADRIDVEAIDARAGKPGEQAFQLIQGGFTAEGQIRVIQSGKDTIVQFNTTGNGGADMEILLKNFDRGDISAVDFVL